MLESDNDHYLFKSSFQQNDSVSAPEIMPSKFTGPFSESVDFIHNTVTSKRVILKAAKNNSEIFWKKLVMRNCSLSFCNF